MEQVYKAEDCGLLIGLINVPMGTKLSDFFKKEMKETIFQQYRVNIFKDDKKNSKTNYLYTPHAYHLLGDHNLAVLSLVDDFAFAQRVFHSSHCFTRKKDNKTEDYKIRTITGVSTYPADQSPRLLDRARKTFLLSEKKISKNLSERTEPYPFIGIVRYKLNNGLLIGNGQDYLEAVKETLEILKETIIEEYQEAITLLMVDSFCNNELTLVIFAHDPQIIFKFVMSSRQKKISDLNQTAKEKIRNQVLEKADDDQTFNQLHLFSSSHTMLGFDLDLFSKRVWLNKLKPVNFPVKFYWDIKPGHLSNVNNALEEMIGSKNKKGTKKIVAGVSSLVYEQEFTLKEYISFYKKWKKQTYPDYLNDLRDIRTSMEVEIEVDPHKDSKHSFKPLFRTTKKKNIIDQLHHKLLYLGTPKVLEQRIQKVFSNFNDCITDPLFAIYFMELWDYLDCLNTIIEDVGEKGDLEKLHESLNEFITNFEKAYYNRFHHSNRIIGMDDFNLEYNGGIQQLLSGFDAVYKYIAHLFTEVPIIDDDTSQEEHTYNKRPSFPHVICVSGYERVYSDKWRMMINILYITYPELFAATIWKEALNFFFRDDAINHLEQLVEGDRFDFLLDQFKEKGFPDYIRNEICRSDNFDRSAYSHRLLSQTLNISFLKYILIDGLVLKSGYREDFDLFYYWYWKVFLQMNHLMEKTSKEDSISYHPDNFIIMLFRLTYWAYYLDKKSGGAEIRINEIRHSPFDPALRDLWILHFNDVYTYVKIFFNKLESMEFNYFIDSIADNLDTQLLPDFDPVENPFSEVGKKTEQKKYSKKEEREFQQLRKQKKKIYQKLTKKAANHFRQNKIITYEQEEKKPLYLSLVLRTYLAQIRDLDTKKVKTDARYALQRTPQGLPMEQNDNYTHLLSDPYGGIFILNDPAIRKKYYILRSVFYKSIWDFSMKSKKEIFPISNEDENKK